MHLTVTQRQLRGDPSGGLWARAVARADSVAATATCEFFGKEVGAIELGLRLRVADFGQLPHQVLHLCNDMGEEGPILRVISDTAEEEAAQIGRSIGPNLFQIRHHLRCSHQKQNLERKFDHDQHSSPVNVNMYRVSTEDLKWKGNGRMG